MTRDGFVPVLLLVCAVPLLFGGCVSPGRVSESAVGFNLAVEKAQNEMLLINSLRASRRWPMYLTGIQSVTGSLRTEYSAGIEFPFGKKTDSFNKGIPRATYIVNPTFQVPVLDTQEFMKGFLAPVPVKTLQYYWDQGWPQPLLLHLLVQRVRVRVESRLQIDSTDAQGNPRKVDKIQVVDYYFDNYPDSRDRSLCEFVKFSNLIDRYLDPAVSNPSFEVKTSEPNIGPLLSREEAAKLRELVAANKEGLKLAKVPKGFRLRRTITDIVLTSNSLEEVRKFSEEQKKSENLCQQGARKESEAILYLKDPPLPNDSEDQEEGGATTYERGESAKSAAEKPKISVEFFLRSPEALLYYLGELVRVEEDLGLVPEVCVQSEYEPIFVARKWSLGCPTGGVETEFDEEMYLIPRRSGPKDNPNRAREECVSRSNPLYTSKLACISGRSMQAISLLNQIISLQKSAQDLPATSLVRTIGQ